MENTEHENAHPSASKRLFAQLLLLAILLCAFVLISMTYSFFERIGWIHNPPVQVTTGPASDNSQYAQLVKDTSTEVFPSGGYQTKLVLGDVVLKMVAAGIIDVNKITALYKNSGSIPPEIQQMLTQPSTQPLTIDAKNATWLMNILWPVGLSNKMAINAQSPISGKNVNNFASTGGWTLGKAASGGVYFNSTSLIPLTAVQEKRVQQIAANTYRPCCDNSSFFQDCNHGSAALGIIELGVSENLSDTEIYQTLLAFNSYWFSQNYLETALYFKVVKNTDWKDVNPQLALSKDYSSLSGWMKNVDGPVSKIPGLLHNLQSGASCGV